MKSTFPLTNLGILVFQKLMMITFLEILHLSLCYYFYTDFWAFQAIYHPTIIMWVI